MLPLSVLDLAPVVEGGDVPTALRQSAELARHAERLGFRRFWLAEHHGMVGVASAATAVVIGHVAAATSTIRVGAGGIMLPNHAPLVIAEQFGTLDALHPGRIDLALGRAPGSDPVTAAALRRDPRAGESFPQDVLELVSYLRGDSAVRAVPGAGADVPLWILGSSLFGASLAAAYGLPFAFASHFAPMQLADAVAVYRREFQPSAALDRPHLMLAMNAIAADTDAEAQRLFTSLQQAFANLRRGRPGPLPPPVDDIHAVLAPADFFALEQMLSVSAVGTRDTVRRGIERIRETFAPDELIVATSIHDHGARLRSYEIVGDLAASS